MTKQKTKVHIALTNASSGGGLQTALPEMVLCALLSVVCVSLLLQMFALPCYAALIYVFAVLCPLGLSFLVQKIGGRTLALYLLFASAAVCALFYGPLWSGCLVIANQIFIVANGLQNFTFVLYETGVPQGQEALYGTLALLVGVVLFSAALVLGIRQRLLAAVFLLTAPFPLLVIYFSLKPPLLSLLTLAFAWVFLAVFCAVSGKRGRTMTISQNSNKLVITVSAAVIAVVFVFYGAFSLFLSEDAYAASGGTSGLKGDIISAVDRLRYEKNSGIVELPRGDLSKAQSLHYTWNEALIVRLEKPRSLYLKGFTGGAYKDNRWGDLPDEAYAGEYTGLFAWLGHNDFYAQTQLGRIGEMTMGAQNGWISVTNLSLNSKTVYAPYEIIPTQDLASDRVNYMKDSGIFSRGLFGMRTYTFDMYLPVVEDYGAVDLHYWLGSEVLENPAYQEYLAYEKVYRTFVYDSYLAVSEKEAELLKGYFSEETLAELKNRDYRAVVRDIRQYFSGNFTFSYEVAELEEGAGFVAAFLESGEGYDVHFSTLAALLLRTAGIPARYVEGFYISPRDAALYTELTSITFYLPDAAAHAWVEIYADGIGWLPVEFTPGYFTLVKNESNNEGTTQLLKENNSYFYIEDIEVPVEPDPPDDEMPETLFSIRALLPFIIALLLVSAYFIARAVYMKSQRRRFAQADTRQAALARYARLSKLLRFDGTRMNHRAAYAVLNGANGKYDVEEFSLERFLDVVYIARFSAGERTLDQEESGYLRDYAEAAARSVYARQKAPKKLWMHLIWLV
ncbi:MAG: transglutaminase-like domain-containing protein [Clostridiales bacterium]|nr:transglutaminase-like domain-containing protein [Clostridiales bacterium]